jgi:hypothetical protein
MRLRLMASMSMAGALLLGGACTADREPTAPKSTAVAAPSFSVVGAAAAADINTLIDALFPPKGLLTAAHAQFTNIQRVLGAGQIADAQAKAFALIDFASQKFFNNQLIGKQMGPTQTKLLQLINDLLSFVGLSDGTDAAVQVVGPSGGPVVTGTQLAGANFPPGALPQNVVVTINRAPNQIAPLPTVLSQYPLFYEFKTFPEVPQFGQLVTVGVCVLDAALGDVDPANLRLAHPLHSDPSAIEILPLAPANFIDAGNCSEADDYVIGARKGLRNDLASAGRTVARNLFWLAMGAPRDLSATSTRRLMPGGLGGRTGSFSTFGAVDFTDSEFVPYQEIGYRYLELGAGETPPEGFEQPDFDASSWFTGRGAFGSKGEPCTFLDNSVHTDWPTATDGSVEILLRKRFSGSAQNVHVLVPVDNDVRVFVNGTDITASGGEVGEDGFLAHEGCADPAEPFDFSVDNSLLLPGGNLVVVRARDRGVVSYVDVKVTGSLPTSEP